MAFVGVARVLPGKKRKSNRPYHARLAVVLALRFRPLLHVEHEARRFSSSYHAPPIATGKM